MYSSIEYLYTTTGVEDVRITTTGVVDDAYTTHLDGAPTTSDTVDVITIDHVFAITTETGTATIGAFDTAIDLDCTDDGIQSTTEATDVVYTAIVIDAVSIAIVCTVTVYTVTVCTVIATDVVSIATVYTAIAYTVIAIDVESIATHTNADIATHSVVTIDDFIAKYIAEQNVEPTEKHVVHSVVAIAEHVEHAVPTEDDKSPLALSSPQDSTSTRLLILS